MKYQYIIELYILSPTAWTYRTFKVGYSFYKFIVDSSKTYTLGTFY